MAWALSWCSRVLTGYGVDLKAVVGVMLVIFAIPTAVYWYAGFTHFVSYSVVTFVTAPPPTPAIPDLVTRGVALAQTFLGTLSTVLLGYVLATRESI